MPATSSSERFPKYTKFSIYIFTVFIHLYGLVYTQVLVITCHNLYRATIRVVVNDKVLQQIKEVLFFTDSSQHGRQFYASSL